MERVRKRAGQEVATTGLEPGVYGGYTNSDKLEGDDLDSARAGHNFAWIQQAINQGREIIDIGPEEGRTNYPESRATRTQSSSGRIEHNEYHNVRREY
jgi:hypothetical protein